MMSLASMWVIPLMVGLCTVSQVCTKQHYGMRKLNIPQDLSSSDHNRDHQSHDDNRAHKPDLVWKYTEDEEGRESNEVVQGNNNGFPPAVHSDPEWLYYIKSISEDMKSVKRQLSNIKYENHLLYKQVKRMQTKCGNQGNDLHSKYQGTLGGSGGEQSDDPLPDSLPACPKGFLWHKDSNTCHRLESDRITWHSARDSCQSMGADLVAVETAREQRYLNEEASKRADTRHCDFWTGGTDKHSEGKWYWIATNKPMSYMNWNHNEPNNGGHNEHCLQMLWVFNWAWNDSDCRNQKACYICEINRRQ